MDSEPHHPRTNWLGLDIGGANVKASIGPERSWSVPFALWEHPEALSEVLTGLASEVPEATAIALTMTAELCDCFSSKAEGVRTVLNAVRHVWLEMPTWVWGIDARFHRVETITETPRLAAASNWLALAEEVAATHPEAHGLLIDIGSTTTDLIGFADGQAMPRGRTDFDRLRSGELVYAGALRTPISALATWLNFRGSPTGLAAERFATTLDIYNVLRWITPDPDDLETADGRPRTREASRDRLARMVCLDGDDFREGEAIALARAAHEALIDRLIAAGQLVIEHLRTSTHEGRPWTFVVSGSAEFLAEEVAGRLGSSTVPHNGEIVQLSQLWGVDASAAGPAYAVRKRAHRAQAVGLLS